MGPANALAWISSRAAMVQRVFAPLGGHRRGVVGVVVVAILLTVGACIGWAKLGGMIKARPKYLLTANSIEITPQPAWIHSDVAAEVVRDGSLAELSILDPDLTRRVVRAFELNTWVDEVVWAGKRPGKDAPRMIVKLKYREPVIMVRTYDAEWKGDCFWPVDTEGVLLPPSEFSPKQTRNYLRVHASNSLPAIPVGTLYADPGVTGAASIAKTIQKIWKPSGLEWIVVQKSVMRDGSDAGEPTFILLPSGASPDALAQRISNHQTNPTHLTSAPSQEALEVRWGHAPGRESVGEPTPLEKASRLWQFVQQNGQLDQLPGKTIIDLRAGPAISVTTR